MPTTLSRTYSLKTATGGKVHCGQGHSLQLKTSQQRRLEISAEATARTAVWHQGCAGNRLGPANDSRANPKLCAVGAAAVARFPAREQCLTRQHLPAPVTAQ